MRGRTLYIFRRPWWYVPPRRFYAGVAAGAPAPSVTDSISVTEAVEAFPTLLFITETESITATEAFVVATILNISETETITISESVATPLFDPGIIWVQEVVAMQVGLPSLKPTATETITTSEVVVAEVFKLFITITDTVTVLEETPITLTVAPAIFPPMLFRKYHNTLLRM